MSSSAPVIRSSGSGPNGVGDTTLFIATAASYASDGPTLPMINLSKDSSDARPAKKQKTDNGTVTEPAEPAIATKKSQADLAPLYKPWTLLPPELLQQIEKRLGGKWDRKVEVVVFTKNQNVKSGINRLKTLLGFEEAHLPGREREDEAKGGKGDGIIAISACDEGTTKMVGIVEMTKRVVSGGNGTKDIDGESWYAYTTLTGLHMQARQEESTQSLEEKGGRATEKDLKNKLPVLTAWFSRRSMPEFKVAFGEQTFTVLRHPSSA